MKINDSEFKKYVATIGTPISNKVICGLMDKGINDKTIFYCLNYLYCNKVAYGDIFDINELADNILQNLSTSIKNKLDSVNILQILAGYLFVSGQYKPNKGTIYTNPFLIAMPLNESYVARIGRKRLKRMYIDSTIRHEFDHCALTKWEMPLSKEEIIKLRSKNNLAKAFSEKELKQIQNSMTFNSGFCNTKQALRANLTCAFDLCELNEGITTYKEKCYDEVMYGVGIYAPLGVYKVYERAAEHIARVVGKKQMLTLHKQGDYAALRELYKQRCGHELNDLAFGLHQCRGYIDTDIGMNRLEGLLGSNYAIIAELYSETYNPSPRLLLKTNRPQKSSSEEIINE